jgi:PAS domain S-box-containing protein
MLKSIIATVEAQPPISNVIESGPPDVLQRLLSLVAQSVGVPLAWLTFLEPYQRWGTLHYISPDDSIGAVSDITLSKQSEIADNDAIVIPAYMPPPDQVTLFPDLHALSLDDHQPSVPIPTGARFYACAPVYGANTTPVGVLCLADRRAHTDMTRHTQLIVSYTALISEALHNHQIVSRVRIAEAAQRAGESFNQAIIDSLAAHIAVLDRAGTIIAVNTAWKCFAYENGATSDQLIGIGANYLQVCRRSGTLDAQRTLQGLESVLSGAQDTFSLEYPCHSPTTRRWFLLTATPLRHEWGGVVMAHVDITARKLVEDTIKRNAELEQQVGALTRAWQQAQRERELQSLDMLSIRPPTIVNTNLLGSETMQDALPTLFDAMSGSYAQVLDLALDQRAYKTDHGLRERLREVGEQLSLLGAGPRDVIELHTVVLRRKVAGAASERAQAYLEEGRMLVLELMGNLVSLYRLYSQGQSRHDSHGTPGENYL